MDPLLPVVLSTKTEQDVPRFRKTSCSVLVGGNGLEPSTPTMSTWYSNQLS